MIAEVVFTHEQTCHVSLPQTVRSGVVKIRTLQAEWYLGWNGRITPNQLVINQTLGRSLGVGPDALIEEVPAQQLTQIEVEPLDENYWELIEGNSAYLEEHILRQIRVVQSNLIFPIYVREGVVWMKVRDCVQGWGVLREDSEVAVMPKPRPRKPANWLMRNLPRFENLVSKDFTEGSLLACRRRGSLSLGVSSTENIRDGHISWRGLLPFAQYEVTQVLPVMDNQPTLIHRITLEVKRAEFRLKMRKRPGYSLQQRTALYPGLKTENYEIEIEQQGINLQEWLPYIVVGKAQHSEFVLVDESLCLQPAETIIHTPSFLGAARDLSQKEIESFVTTGLPDHGIILQGSSGSGKSTLISLLERELIDVYIATELVRCREQTLKTIPQTIQAACEDAAQKRPCLLVFDDIESVALQTEDNALEVSQEQKLSYQRMSVLITDLLERSEGVKILAGCVHESNLNSLLRTGLAWKTYDTPAFTFKDTLTVLRYKYPYEPDLGQVASQMKSFQPADLFAFLSLFALQSLPSSQLQTQLEQFTPQSLQKKPQEDLIQWEEVGGLFEAKRKARELLHLPIKYSILYRHFQLKQRSGLLLYGPPGCGKTILGQAIPSISGLSFLYVKGPELLNKYIGASEQAVRDLFGQAKRAAPSVIFIDEFEAIGAKRGSTGVTDRIVNQFLCELDGIESRANVYVVGASSRPEMIDSALLRPGRLDLHLYVGFPSQPEREEIFEVILRKLGLDVEVGGILSEGFTGADIKGVINNLQIKLATGEVSELTREVLEEEVAGFQPSFTRVQVKEYEDRYERFRLGKTEKVGQRLSLK